MPVTNVIPRAPLVSMEYTGTIHFPADPNRMAFALVKIAGAERVVLGGGTGEIPLREGDIFRNGTVVTTESIDIVTSGTVIVVATQATHDEAVVT